MGIYIQQDHFVKMVWNRSRSEFIQRCTAYTFLHEFSHVASSSRHGLMNIRKDLVNCQSIQDCGKRLWSTD
jgi:hypothetical protein